MSDYDLMPERLREELLSSVRKVKQNKVWLLELQQTDKRTCESTRPILIFVLATMVLFYYLFIFFFVNSKTKQSADSHEKKTAFSQAFLYCIVGLINGLYEYMGTSSKGVYDMFHRDEFLNNRYYSSFFLEDFSSLIFVS